MNVLMEAIQALRLLRSLESELLSETQGDDDAGYLTPKQEAERKRLRQAAAKDRKAKDDEAAELAALKPGAPDEIDKTDKVNRGDPGKIELRRHSNPSKTLRDLAADSERRYRETEKKTKKRNQGGYGKKEAPVVPLKQMAATTTLVPAKHRITNTPSKGMVSKVRAGGRKMKLHTGTNLTPAQKLSNLDTMHMIHRDVATKSREAAANHPEGAEQQAAHLRDAHSAEAKANVLYAKLQNHSA
jgi:multidrug efflux pump subunit AcrB